MTDYLRHLAAKNLNLEKGVSPRLPAFFEPAAYAGSLFNRSTYLNHEPVLDERKGERIEPRTSSQTSDQSPISVQSEGARTRGPLPQIPAKSDAGFPDAASSPEYSGMRSSRYIFKNIDNSVLKQIRPMKIDLPSIGLDYKQAPIAAQAHMKDTIGKKRALRRRVRRETTLTRQQHQNSLQSKSQAEHKSQDMKENPKYNSRKKNHLDLDNALDRSEAQDSSKGGKDKIGSLFIGGFRGNHFKLRKENDSKQGTSKSIETTGSVAAVINPGTVNRQSLASTSEQPFPDHSLPSSISRPEIADFKMVREKTTPLQQALFGKAEGGNDRSGSVFEMRPEGNHSRLKKANDTDQKISRRIEITGIAATFMQSNKGIKQSAASTSEQPFPDHSLLFSELRPQITDLVNDRKNGSFLVKAISIESIPAERSRAERTGHLERKTAADSYQEAARSPEKAVHTPLAANGKSTIQVTIGRIEVRAERPNRAPSAPPACRPASVSRLSLEEYLKQRSAGQI